MKKRTLISFALAVAMLASASFLYLNSTQGQGRLGATDGIPSIESTPGGIKDKSVSVEVDTIEELRTQIDAANSGSKVSVRLNAGNYVLSGAREENSNAGGDLDIVGDITIEGAGVDATVLDAAQLDRVFDLRKGGSLTLMNLTLKNGNPGEGALGGLIYADNAKKLSLQNVNLIKGVAQEGGAVYSVNNENFTVADSTFRDNEAKAKGGAIYFSALRQATSTIEGSTFKTNKAFSHGAALYVKEGNLALDNSVINKSTVTGGTYSEVPFVPSFYGVSIYNGGDLSISSSSITEGSGIMGNGAGGAIYNAGDLELEQVTISGNFMEDSPQGKGAAIYNYAQGDVKVLFSTLEDNAGALAIYNDGTFSMGASLSAGSCEGSKAIDSLGYNMLAYNTDLPTASYSCRVSGADATSVSGQVPGLAVLAEFKGFPVHKFTTPKTSYAVNRVPEETCQDWLGASPVDQVGQSRVGWCESGAFEVPDSGAPEILIKQTQFKFSKSTGTIGGEPAPRWMEEEFTGGIIDYALALTELDQLLRAAVLGMRDNVDDMSLCSNPDDFRTNIDSVMQYSSMVKTTISGEEKTLSEFAPGAYTVEIAQVNTCQTPDGRTLPVADLSGNKASPLTVTLTISE